MSTKTKTCLNCGNSVMGKDSHRVMNMFVKCAKLSEKYGGSVMIRRNQEGCDEHLNALRKLGATHNI